MVKKVFTENAPNAIGPYSQAVVCDGYLFTSGQIAINPSSGAVETETIIEQTTVVCENLKAILNSQNLDFNSVIKTTCFLKDMNDFAKFNDVYGKYFTSKPARSCVEVARLPKDVLVEIEIIAKLG